jgi:transposase-like protein
MSKSAVVNRGRRYTNAEKAEILGFVEKVNRERGIGGQAAARQKFGLSPLTLKNWIRQASTPGSEGDPTGQTLSRLQALAAKMEKLSTELEAVRGEYDQLKKAL